MELIIDLHECDVCKLTKKNLDIFFMRLCEISKMEAVGRPKYWKCDIDLPHLKGYSGIQFIKTSNIIIHTLDITGDAYINFFSCKDFNVPEVIDFIVEHFGVGFYHSTTILRGHHREKERRETEIEIRFIDRIDARYDTWGDYFMEGDKLIFQIVRDVKEFYTRINLVHEMVECFLCLKNGITFEEIDRFDFSYKAESIHDEPGNDIRSPYYEEHRLAEKVERMMCGQAAESFEEYINTDK